MDYPCDGEGEQGGERGYGLLVGPVVEIALVLLGNLHFASQEATFVDDGGEVFFQGEVDVLVQQGKVHVFRVAVHAVEDTQTGAAIEGCFGKEATSIESAEHYLLHHLV